MSHLQRHIKSHTNTISEESYATLQKPTNATFISKKTMEINEKTKGIRQESEVIFYQSALAKNKKTEGQKKEKSAEKDMESRAIGNAQTYV